MLLKEPVYKGFIITMMVAFITITVQAPATAGVVDNAELSAQVELQMQRAELRDALAREEVRDTLLNYGVSGSDIEQRISNMTPGELNQINGQLASLPAGEGVGGAVLTILLILILLDVVGATDIFPRI